MAGKMSLAGVGRRDYGKQAGISGFSLTRAWEQDLRGISGSKQGDFDFVRARGWLLREKG